MGLTKPFAYLGSTADTGIGYGNPPYDQDLLAYYDFGSHTQGSWTGSVSMSNADVVRDLSGNGFDSTLDMGFEQFTYDANFGKGVISTNTKNGGYFYMDALTGSLAAVTFEFVLNVPTTLTADNLIFRYDNTGNGSSRAESNLQQYGGSPPNRIGCDVRTQQGNNINVGVINQDVGTGFKHLVYTAGQGETTKTYFQGSLLGASSATMSATDTFVFNNTGAQQNTNSWFGTSNYSFGTFQGMIGVYRMYSSVMPASSVLANYNYYSAQF